MSPCTQQTNTITTDRLVDCEEGTERIEGAGQLVQVSRVRSVEVLYPKQEMAHEEVHR